MIDILSYQHAINLLKINYKSDGFTVRERTLGQQVSEEFGNRLIENKHGCFYALLDEQLGLMKFVVWYFTSCLFSEKIRGVQHLRLATSQINALASVRLLCSRGLDIAAKMQLRLLYENSIIWSRLLIDEEAFNDWGNSFAPEEGNKFWHKYISKDKTEKYMKRVAEERGFIWLGNDQLSVASLKRNIGFTTHPTMFASYQNAKYDLNNNSDNGLILGDTVDESITTVMGAMFCVSLPFSIFPHPGFGVKSSDFSKLGHPFNFMATEGDDWDANFEKIIKFILKIYIFSNKYYDELCKNRGCPELAFP